jgi:hypothetical protein
LGKHSSFLALANGFRLLPLMVLLGLKLKSSVVVVMEATVLLVLQELPVVVVVVEAPGLLLVETFV